MFHSKFRLAAVASAVMVVGTAAAQQVATEFVATADHHESGEAGMKADVKYAVCMIRPVAKSGVRGTIFFAKDGGKITVVGKVTGLTPGKHGFHVHEFGDLTGQKDGKSTGGHFDSGSSPHGRPSDPADKRHTGDLGNIEADAEGVATFMMTDTIVAFEGEKSILGRGFVIHADPDDFGQPTGNAGARVGFGVIGIANPESAMKRVMQMKRTMSQ